MSISTIPLSLKQNHNNVSSPQVGMETPNAKQITKARISLILPHNCRMVFIGLSSLNEILSLCLTEVITFKEFLKLGMHQ